MIIALILLVSMISIGVAVTGAILSALIWVCIKLPAAIVLFAIGIAMCCTLILIPMGLKLLKVAAVLLLP